MKQIHSNLKQGIIKLSPENMDDLWVLRQIVEPGDFLKGRTLRKIKKTESTERAKKVIKRPVFMKISVEKTELEPDILRISGKIMEGPDDVPKGSYHTFNVEARTVITLQKEKWLRFQLDRLKEACSAKIPKILIVVFDREEAYFAKMKKYGYSLLTKMKGAVQKKALAEKAKEGFYAEIINQMAEYDKRYGLEKIIIASPAFFKEDLMKVLKDDELKKKIVVATCSSVGANAVDEVLKRDETKSALAEQRYAEELKIVEKLLVEISKEGKFAYGIKETEDAVNAGAVKILLVTDKLIFKLREKEKYGKLEAMMKLVDSMKGEIKIISSEHDAGKKLDGLGGIGAILRYKMSY
jgi:protein pelota